jgi:hypothetical protein
MRLLFSLLLLWGATAFAGNLQKDFSFESPSVTGRTLFANGGDVTHNGHGPGWITLQINGAPGAITAGLTNEIAHTGAQSFFVHFDHVAAADPGVLLVSNFIPVVSGTDYLASIWGRMDAKAPLDPQGRIAYLKLEVDFFAKDANTSVGDPVYSVRPLPGSKNHDPYYNTTAWKAYRVPVPSPPGAVFAQVTWRWETAADEGETNGVMFFDDAEFSGPPNPIPDLTPAPVEEPSPDASASPSASPQ